MNDVLNLNCIQKIILSRNDKLYFFLSMLIQNSSINVLLIFLNDVFIYLLYLGWC